MDSPPATLKQRIFTSDCFHYESITRCPRDFLAGFAAADTLSPRIVSHFAYEVLAAAKVTLFYKISGYYKSDSKQRNT